MTVVEVGGHQHHDDRRPSRQDGHERAAGRVVFFDAYPHLYGGAQRLTHRLARELRNRGLDIAVLTTGWGRFTDHLGADHIPTTVVPTPAALSHYGRATTGRRRLRALAALPPYWSRVTRAIGAERAQLVHLNDHRAMVLGLLPARRIGMRTVWHVHALAGHPFFDRVGTWGVDRVVVPTAGVLGTLPQLADRGTATVIANPGPSVNTPRSGPADRPTVISVGRLHPDKGIDVLVAAFSLMHARCPEARLILIGDRQVGWEAYADDLKASVRRAGLGQAVQFTGHVPDPSQWFPGARLYVQPSRTETFGLAVLEAMAAGLPVVASDIVGLREVVADGSTGVLVPPDAPQALADAMFDVLEVPGRAEQLGRVGAERVRSEFPPDRFVDEFAELYRGLGVVVP